MTTLERRHAMARPSRSPTTSLAGTRQPGRPVGHDRPVHGDQERQRAAADQAAGTAARRGTGRAGQAQPRVLVVDDIPVIRAELRALLEDGGLAVVGEASHGAEGIVLAGRLRPDVILMDLRMPILDGIDATRQITARLAGVRVVMLTAFDDPDLEQAARAAGAWAFLPKGCPAEEICERLWAAAADAG
jgi:CheY-like chemotaxis protein